MARDERLKKAQSAGVDFIETARQKAEEFLKELVQAGGETQSTLDDLLEGGRRTTEALMTTISKEIRRQVDALGLATRIDLQALEARLTGRPAGVSAKTARARSAASPGGAGSSAGGGTAGSAGGGAASAAMTTKAPSATKTSRPRKAAPARTAAKKAAPARTAATAARRVGGVGGAAATAGAPVKKAAKRATKKTAG